MARRRTKLTFSSVLVAILVILITRSGLLEAPAVHITVPPGTYRVTEIYDGDTLAVDMNGVIEKIRMIGVDTPETHDPRKPVQCFGEAASIYTKNLVGQGPVRLEADPTNSNRDRYNRLLRYVYLQNNTLVNSQIIKDGYGFAYVAFPFTKLEEFKQYEDEARSAKRGLWNNCTPVINSNGGIQSNDVE